MALAQPRRRRLDVSQATITTVDAGHATEQTLNVNGRMIFVVGVPIPSVETRSSRSSNSTTSSTRCGTLLLVLGLGALFTS